MPGNGLPGTILMVSFDILNSFSQPKFEIFFNISYVVVEQGGKAPITFGSTRNIYLLYSMSETSRIVLTHSQFTLAEFPSRILFSLQKL